MQELLIKIMHNNRKTCRMTKFDHGQDGFYFVTICTNERLDHFGKIEQNKMHLSSIGKYAKKCWNEIPNHFPFVELDEYIIMPNHIHGLLFINKSGIGIQQFESNKLEKKFYKNNPNKYGSQSKNIASIIRGFKIGVTKHCRNETEIYKVWQSGYHLRVIFEKSELNRVRNYITNNPSNWKSDRFNK